MPVSASVSIAGRAYVPGADRGVAVLFAAATWVLQRLPGQVIETQRAELIRTLHQAKEPIPGDRDAARRADPDLA